MSKICLQIIGFVISIAFIFNTIQTIDGQKEEQIEAKAHKEYTNIECYYPKITAMTKMRDNKYFLAIIGKKFWFVSESDEVNDKNARDLSTITKEWDRVDASFYYGFNSECSEQMKDKLVLVHYNEETKTNEVLLGSLADWKWNSLIWTQIQAFSLTAKLLNWTKSIDAIAVIEETIFIFQDSIQVRVQCVYKNHWKYEIINDFKEIKLSGAFDAAYFDDQHKDTLPLYVIRDQYYHICYIKITNDEFPSCDTEDLYANGLVPKPHCFVASDPNARLMSSMFVQILILFMLILAMGVFASIHLIRLWSESSPDSTPKMKNVSQPKSPKKSPKKAIQSPDKDKTEQKPEEPELLSTTKPKSPEPKDPSNLTEMPV